MQLIRICRGQRKQTIGNDLQESNYKDRALKLAVRGVPAAPKIFSCWLGRGKAFSDSAIVKNCFPCACSCSVNVVSPINFKSTYPCIGKPYYFAKTSIRFLAIVVWLLIQEIRTMVQILTAGGHDRNVFEPFPLCHLKPKFWRFQFGHYSRISTHLRWAWTRWNRHAVSWGATGMWGRGTFGTSNLRQSPHPE